MLIDSFLTIIMEHSSFEGNRGDAAAETSRYAHCEMLNGNYTVLSKVNLKVFLTLLGGIRHPQVPEDWKEKDFSEDQGKPLYLALKRAGMPEADKLKKFIKDAGWRMGNGDLITPGFYAILNDWQWLSDVSVLVQSLIFKLPYRWSDSKKWFERTEGSSSDYLNHFHSAVYSPLWIRRLTSKEVMKQKFRDYLKDEPNSQWVIDSYEQALERHW